MNQRITNFFELLRDSWQSKDIRKRLLFTLGMLFAFKIGASITIPGVSVAIGTLTATNSASGSLINTLGVLGGGGLKYFSIFALGVSPYITASIIIQLLSANVIPYLTNLSKAGEKGRKTQDMVTRLITLPIAILQSIGIIELLQSQKAIQFHNTASVFIFIILIQISGVYLALWMGDQINERGLGNGVSMIILTGVVSAIPFNFINIFRISLVGQHALATIIVGITKSLATIGFYFILVIITIFVSQSYRKIPVRNIGSGLNKKKSDRSYILLRINISGVIPVIFASALMAIPLTIMRYVTNAHVTTIFNYLFNRNYPTALITNCLLITLFVFFYSRITINPERFAENLQKSGSFIPGINPGRQTAKHIISVVNRINLLGSFFLSFITIIPFLLMILFHLPVTFGIGGTGILIFVVIILDLISQVRSRLIQVDYRQLKYVMDYSQK